MMDLAHLTASRYVSRHLSNATPCVQTRVQACAWTCHLDMPLGHATWTCHVSNAAPYRTCLYERLRSCPCVRMPRPMHMSRRMPMQMFMCIFRHTSIHMPGHTFQCVAHACLYTRIYTCLHTSKHMPIRMPLRRLHTDPCTGLYTCVGASIHMSRYTRPKSTPARDGIVS